MFSWPTEWVSADVFSSAWDNENYDRSERKAYVSGFALRMLLIDLNQNYPGRVRVVSHSIGAVVVSEALRLEAESASPDVLVHTYVASQGAMAADAYDPNAPDRTQPINGWETPEVYGSYPVTGQPYYGNIGRTAANLINFFNPVDNALGWWETNQDTKPDDGWEYYEATNLWQRNPGTALSFPDDTYEIYAHIAEGRSMALGRQPGVVGPFDPTREVNLRVAFSFGDDRNGHSAQFLFSNMELHRYWEALLTSFDL